MKGQNILIAIGVFGIAVILYKLLLGFVIPIALLVSLVFVLKFLIKGSDSDSEEDDSQILTNREPTSVTDNIVEIKPIKEDRTIKEEKISEEDKSVDKSEAPDEDINLDN